MEEVKKNIDQEAILDPATLKKIDNYFDESIKKCEDDSLLVLPIDASWVYDDYGKVVPTGQSLVKDLLYCILKQKTPEGRYRQCIWEGRQAYYAAIRYEEQYRKLTEKIRNLEEGFHKQKVQFLLLDTEAIYEDLLLKIKLLKAVKENPKICKRPESRLAYELQQPKELSLEFDQKLQDSQVANRLGMDYAYVCGKRIINEAFYIHKESGTILPFDKKMNLVESAEGNRWEIVDKTKDELKSEENEQVEYFLNLIDFKEVENDH